MADQVRVPRTGCFKRGCLGRVDEVLRRPGLDRGVAYSITGQRQSGNGQGESLDWRVDLDEISATMKYDRVVVTREVRWICGPNLRG